MPLAVCAGLSPAGRRRIAHREGPGVARTLATTYSSSPPEPAQQLVAQAQSMV